MSRCWLPLIKTRQNFTSLVPSGPTVLSGDSDTGWQGLWGERVQYVSTGGSEVGEGAETQSTVFVGLMETISLYSFAKVGVGNFNLGMTKGPFRMMWGAMCSSDAPVLSAFKTALPLEVCMSTWNLADGCWSFSRMLETFQTPKLT